VTTVLQARPRRFVSTPSIERVATRALRYLQSGYPVHLRGPAGTGKTTLALHLADLLSRPIMLLFGDDEFKTSDLIGNQLGYTRKKVVDNFIHSVVKMEDELRHNWVDSRLTLACREGFTLVYDEFNRSRPEVNNVLLSALEEKLLVLPPNGNRTEYIRVDPNFRAIFTSNPEEYCGVHETQDALLDRMITINMPEPDELTQQEIVVHKTGIDRLSAATIVKLVRAFRSQTGATNSSGLRPCLMIGKVCFEHQVEVVTANEEFRDICQDMLLSRTDVPLAEATQLLWDIFNGLIVSDSPVSVAHGADHPSTAVDPHPPLESDAAVAQPDGAEEAAGAIAAANGAEEENLLPTLPSLDDLSLDLATHEVSSGATLAAETGVTPPLQATPYAADVYAYLQVAEVARPSELEAALGINRVQAVNALRSLLAQGLITQQSNGDATSIYQLSALSRDRLPLADLS
jgi:gas vesicle protein GvpN